LVEHTRAVRIGRMMADDCYLFQIPGTHHLLRPTVRLADGYRLDLERPANEFFLATAGGVEFLVFLGTEPHRRERAYAKSFLDVLDSMGVRSAVSVAGVHAPVPHRRPRRVSCVTSRPGPRPILEALRLRYSNYEGGATIGMLFATLAGRRGRDFTRLCAHVPAYEFSAGPTLIRSMTMDLDYSAWRGLLARINKLLGLSVDLAELDSRSSALTSAWDEQLEELSDTLPHLEVYDALDRMEAEFDSAAGTAHHDSQGDLWDSALRDILGTA
jgi:hypothetical protein